MLFKNFPTINYNLKELSNILIRFNFLNLNVLNDFCEYYYVNDEDSPESLSVTYYNDSFYSWVILFINDKFNRELDWPLASNKMDDYLSAKYDYSSVFVSENGIDYSFSKVKKIKYGTYYSKTIDVKNYDRTFNRFDLMEKIPENILASSTQIYLVDENNNNLDIVDLVVHESRYCLHHFEDAEEKQTDPRIDLDGYITNLGTQNTIITNVEYEQKLNDSKREIKILKKEYLSNLLDLIKSILKEANKRKDIENA
jgi:hypothetical protein